MNALHPLGQLIQSVEDSRGWTLREIARRIDERAGRTISHAYVARLKKKPISSVTYETIHALAVGLDVPERLVGAAALETMGVRDLDQSEAGAAVAIARDPGLSERDRRILLAAVREMQDATDTEQHEPATTPPIDVEDPAQPDGSTSTPPSEARTMLSGLRSMNYYELTAEQLRAVAADLMTLRSADLSDEDDEELKEIEHDYRMVIRSLGEPGPAAGGSPDDYVRAAMAGHSQLEQDDAAAGHRGEESQDPGTEDPA